MPAYEQISIDQAQQKLASQSITLIDIRDISSYHSEHINTAIHLSDTNLDEFLRSTPRNTPLIVYCHHGISSQSAADYFITQGFAQVYSLRGGFEAWQQHTK